MTKESLKTLSAECFAQDDKLCINNHLFESRLMIGTGRYKNLKEAIESINASSTSIVTVAIRRAKYAKSQGKTNLIDGLNWRKLWLLPNTAGCSTAEEAIKIASLSKEINKKIGQIDNNFIKLEVISDAKYLLPDPIGTLKAAEYLVKNDFTVLPYVNSDPILAKQLEDIGCSTIMPLGSPIGSGQGLKNIENIKIIVENSKIPVIVDAGIGATSEANQAMEIGASAVLLNTAVAKSKKPKLMASAMKYAVISGRNSFLAGRMKKQVAGIETSPKEGQIMK
uniref:Thiazole synthase n=1 Tax=Platysiphonia delicata TaxID=2006979 RepID=A0A1Z1M0E2_9FLOR|nr:thiG protein [Platysiphonia delicata]ARW59516.1 thiG protein [Platysiphonia delicata]